MMPRKPSPLDFIIVDDELLLQHLNRIQAARLLLFCQHDLAEVTLTKHSKEVEVVEANFPLPTVLLLSRCLLLWRWWKRHLALGG